MPGERAQTVRVGEPCWIVTDLGKDAGGEDRAQAWCRAQDRRLRVLVELAGQFEFEVVDGSLHRDDDAEQPGHGLAQCLLDLRRLPKGGGVQVGEDLLNQGGMVTAAAMPLPDDGSAAGCLPGSARLPARSMLPCV